VRSVTSSISRASRSCGGRRSQFMCRVVRSQNRLSPRCSQHGLVGAVVAVRVLGLTVFATACGEALELEPGPPNPIPFRIARTLGLKRWRGLASSGGQRL
jgi:hypothetical protein